MKEFFKIELEGKEKDSNTPRKARFIIQATEGIENLPGDWDHADMSVEGTPYLVPEVKMASGKVPAMVLVDDAGFYRGYVPFDDPQFHDKLTVELSRIVSHQYLLHYVTRQTLMWRKANGRDKGEASQSSH